jgi:ppGpp synthetase/RelA/SpoT-type nucleotidyltranferase
VTEGAQISRKQADMLGKALRHEELTEDLLTRLNLYRDQVVHATSDAVDTLRLLTGYAITPREGKSTLSVIAKLRRQTTSLSQVQDLVGCRIIVDTIIEQESLRLRVAGRFPDAKIVDRRMQPSHGYRAVHFILPWQGRSYEVQIRTRLQHAWAQTVERLSDSKVKGLKYGFGPPSLTALIASLSAHIAEIESFELKMFESRGELADQAGPVASTVEQWRTELISSFETLLELEWST